MTAFVISASMAGAAGALFALNYSTIAANKFDFNTSILVLVFVVFGGLGNMLGSVIAAALLTALPEALRSFADYRMLIYAIVLILVMLATNNDDFKALLRRVERAKVIAKNSENEKLLDFGSMVIDPAQRIVTVNGEQVHLTPTEFDLLATLARRPKSVLTREKLLEEVWDWVDASGTRTVDSHVKALRHKLGADTIRTVHGVGYAFEPPTA